MRESDALTSSRPPRGPGRALDGYDACRRSARKTALRCKCDASASWMHSVRCASIAAARGTAAAISERTAMPQTCAHESHARRSSECAGRGSDAMLFGGTTQKHNRRTPRQQETGPDAGLNSSCHTRVRPRRKAARMPALSRHCGCRRQRALRRRQLVPPVVAGAARRLVCFPAANELGAVVYKRRSACVATVSLQLMCAQAHDRRRTSDGAQGKQRRPLAVLAFSNLFSNHVGMRH